MKNLEEFTSTFRSFLKESAEGKPREIKMPPGEDPAALEEAMSGDFPTEDERMNSYKTHPRPGFANANDWNAPKEIPVYGPPGYESKEGVPGSIKQGVKFIKKIPVHDGWTRRLEGLDPSPVRGYAFEAEGGLVRLPDGSNERYLAVVFNRGGCFILKPKQYMESVPGFIMQAPTLADALAKLSFEVVDDKSRLPSQQPKTLEEMRDPAAVARSRQTVDTRNNPEDKMQVDTVKAANAVRADPEEGIEKIASLRNDGYYEIAPRLNNKNMVKIVPQNGGMALTYPPSPQPVGFVKNVNTPEAALQALGYRIVNLKAFSSASMKNHDDYQARQTPRR